MGHVGFGPVAIGIGLALSWISGTGLSWHGAGLELGQFGTGPDCMAFDQFGWELDWDWARLALG